MHSQETVYGELITAEGLTTSMGAWGVQDSVVRLSDPADVQFWDSFAIMRLCNASFASTVDSTDIDFLFQQHVNKPANLNPAICASCPPIDLFPGLGQMHQQTDLEIAKMPMEPARALRVPNWQEDAIGTAMYLNINECTIQMTCHRSCCWKQCRG